MLGLQNGAFPLFRVAGITVFLHWSWLAVAFIQTRYIANRYTAPVWGLLEYVALFAIVLVHEFGHALACRQVGGVAERIVLWPLGGVAYVAPPQRPGAYLWSIAAGPLVNVVLVPITLGLYFLSRSQGWAATAPNLDYFLVSIALINGLLLFFNLLPIYPLDGGQILQALLWFFIGRAASLMVVSIIGLIAGLGLVVLTLLFGVVVVMMGQQDWQMALFWIGVIALFIAFRSWVGFQQSRFLMELLRAPRHMELACPSCGARPPMGEFWTCDECQINFDLFAERGSCPECGEHFRETVCPECHERLPVMEWFTDSTEMTTPTKDGTA